jgi:hypothetical protein
MSCGSSAPISNCHAAPARHSNCQHCGRQHCGSQHCGSRHCGSQHCGSQHCGAASCHSAPLMGRVETKIFVFVFPRKVFFSFENTNLFAKTFGKTKIFTEKKIFAKAKIFAKSENDSAPCDYGFATLLSDIVILCNFNMLMRRVSLGLKRKPLFSGKNKRKFSRFLQNFVSQTFLLLRKCSFSRKYSFSRKFSRKIFGPGWFSRKVFVFAKNFTKSFRFCKNFRFRLCFFNNFVLEAFCQKLNFFN